MDDTRPGMGAASSPGDRTGDEAMAALAERLVPGLARRLEGPIDEIEVAREGWRVRVRRPFGGPPGSRPAPEGAASAVAGGIGRHAGPVGIAAHGAAPSGTAPAGGLAAAPAAHPAGLPHFARPAGIQVPGRATARTGQHVATAPAVGVFMPRGDVATGSRVRSGDRLGIVDLLGVPQDVLAPVDGILVHALVEAGEGVEYGQELMIIEAAP